MSAERPVTSMTTITVMVLKEFRLENDIHQAQVAERCGKSPSAWTKIESGQSGCSMETFFQACAAYGIETTDVLDVVEDYADYLYDHGWAICDGSAGEIDQLRTMMAEFYGSDVFKRRRRYCRDSIMETPSRRRRSDETQRVVDVIRFATDEKFRECILNDTDELDLDSLLNEIGPLKRR